MGDYGVTDPTYQAMNAADDGGDDLSRSIARIMSPTPAAALVPPPPDVAPKTAPGVSTPQTGSLNYAPLHDTAKNMDTPAGRAQYSTSPIGALGQPYATGTSRPPDNGDVRTISPAVQPVGSVQPASTNTTSGGVKTVIRDLNGRPAGSPLSYLSASRPSFGAQGTQQASSVQPQVGPLMPAGMGNGSANNFQPVRPAQSTVSPVQPVRQGVQPIIPPGQPQPVQPYRPGVPLATQQAQRMQAYGAGPGPAQYAARMSPVATDPANPDPNASLRPGGSSVAGAMPVPPASASQVNAPSQLDSDQARLRYLQSSGSGISQIQNPVGKVAATAGDIGLRLFFPGLEPFVGGTEGHHQMLVNKQLGVVGGDQSQLQAAAQLEDTQSQTAERTAKVQQDIANAGKADRYDPNAVHTVNTSEGVMGFDPDTGQYDRRIGGSPDKLQEGERPLGAMVPQLNKTLQDRYQVLNPGKPLPAQYALPATATQKDYDRIDKALGGVESAQGTQTQRQQALALRQQAMAATEAARGANSTAALDRESKQFSTGWEKQNDAGDAQLEKIADARAMVNGNAESQALGIPKVLTALVGGQGTGVRITTPELNAIAKARGWQGDVEGTLNSISGKGKLTSTQQKQLTQIMDDVKQRIVQKQAIASEALDGIYNGATREDIIKAHQAGRQKLADLESGKTPGTQPAAKTSGFDWNAHPKVNP